MNIQKYVTYLAKCRKLIHDLSQETGYSQFYHWFDYLSSVLLHGTLIRQYTIGNFWKLSNPERSRRFTYPRMCKMMNKLNQKDYIHFLDKKVDFNSYFKEFVKRDWIHIKSVSVDEFESFLQKHDVVIIKPVAGVEGGGVRKFIYSNSPQANIMEFYQTLYDEDVLIEECIRQHPRMVFGNTSVNTIRTMTVFGRDKRGHVVKAILRAGVGDTVADNYALGGSIYEVDVNSGVINSYGKSKVGDIHLKHPGTDIIMLGYQVPNWEKVIEISEKAAEHLPQVGIIGWDVAISEDSVQLIEGNHNPDYELYEFIGTTGYYNIITKLIK